MLWNDKPYHSLNYHLRTVYGEKLYKIALNGGMSCPNRDGKLDTRGCIFCSMGGSGEFAGKPCDSITRQIETGRVLLHKKTDTASYIGYFQAFTNTYAPVAYLRQLFTEAIAHPNIKILSIATRPDCLSDEILDLLAELSQIKPIWIELGLQTIHEATASFIRRGYPLSVYQHAVEKLKLRKIPVVTHVILGLPGETLADNLQTIQYLNTLGLQGIKLQLLHILKDTDLAGCYQNNEYNALTLEAYIKYVTSCLAYLNPSIVVHRITGDGPRDLLIAPKWSLHKRMVLNAIHKYMKQNSLWQGMYLNTN